MSKVCKLIFVDGDVNHNKIYNMTDLGTGNWKAEWGRVGSSLQSTTFGMNVWDKKYNEKIKKGYKDVTENYVEEIVNEDTSNSNTKSNFVEFSKTRANSVVDFVKKLMGYANKSIQENYTVSSKQVTQKQVDNAQAAFNKIAGLKADKDTYKEINNALLELYSIIPRKMGHVKDYLLNIDDSDIEERFNGILKSEQDTLDVMAGQVLLNNDIKEAQGEAEIETDIPAEIDILEAAGLELIECTDDENKMLKNMMDYDKNKFHRAFKVINKSTQSRFENHIKSSKIDKKQLLWHGSRNENWWNIFQTGLLIRPSSAVYSGSMWADGIYFASSFDKSLGYTSISGSRWAGGSNDTAILAVFEVHVGKQLVFDRHTSEAYKLSKQYLKDKGDYDSTHARKGPSLYRDEFIVYDTAQCTIQYVVEVRGSQY